MLFLSQARLAHTRATQKDRQHPNHTLRETPQYQWGAREARAPSVLLLARAKRAPPLVCGLDVGGLFVWHVCGLALSGSEKA